MKKKTLVFVLLMIFAICGIKAKAESVDFSQIDAAVKESNIVPSQIFQKIISGDFALSNESILNNFIEILFSSVKAFLPQFFLTLGTSILLTVVVKLELLTKNSSKAAVLGGKVMLCTSLLSGFSSCAVSVKNLIAQFISFLEKIAPVLSGYFVVSAQAKTSVTVQSSFSLFLFIVAQVLIKAVFPLIIAMTIVMAINSLLSDSKLKGIGELLKSISKWILGTSASLFCGISTIGTIGANTFDKMKLQGLKYTVSSAVPIIGGSIGDSVTAILTEAVFIKNAIGVCAMIVLCMIFAMPILNMTAILLLLRFAISVNGMWCENSITQLLESIAEGYKMMTITLVGISVTMLVFLGFISCGLL